MDKDRKHEQTNERTGVHGGLVLIYKEIFRCEHLKAKKTTQKEDSSIAFGSKCWEYLGSE